MALPRSIGFDCKSLKLGPGDTLRSHSADEFIYLNEIEEESTCTLNTK
jgi:acetylornithine deacetylase/succinyl-diaminopimelate desuccinylase-like protein